jgi:hypothetical protein
MEKSLKKSNFIRLAIILIAALTIVASVFIYSSSNRYEAVGNEGGGMYRLDKKTGEVIEVRGRQTTVMIPAEN